MGNHKKCQLKFSFKHELGIQSELLEQYVAALKAADGLAEKVDPEIMKKYQTKILDSKNSKILVGNYIYLSERMVDPVDYEMLDAGKPADVKKFAKEKYGHIDCALVETYDLVRNDIWERMQIFHQFDIDGQNYFQQELIYFQKLLTKQLQDAEIGLSKTIHGQSLQDEMTQSYAKRCYQRAAVGLGAVEDLIKRFEKNFQNNYQYDYIWTDIDEHHLPNVNIVPDSSTNEGRAVRGLSHEPEVGRL